MTPVLVIHNENPKEFILAQDFQKIPNYIDLVKQNLENTVCFEKCCKFDSRPYFFSEFIENLIHKFPENIKISVGVVHVTDGRPLEVPKKDH